MNYLIQFDCKCDQESRVIELGLELDIEYLPVKKNTLIELFPPLILNNMSILGDSTKSAEWYV